MKRLILVVAITWLLLGQILAAAPPPQGRGRKHAHKEHARSEYRSDSRVDMHVAFGRADVVIIRDHYAPRYRNLPPGLRKKLARGGQLPPGWQRKFEPFPVGLERRLPPLAPDYRRGVIDGHAVIYRSRSNVIVDIAVLF